MVDGDSKWVGGKSHFVLCGDLVDRGPDDRAILDLVRRLQKEAKSAGGVVHVLLGNHEVMNLIRDLRYVTDGGYAAFADVGQVDTIEIGRNQDREGLRLGAPVVEVRGGNALASIGCVAIVLVDQHQPVGVRVGGAGGVTTNSTC